MSKRERRLEDKGYQYSGEFSSDFETGKQQMKDAAAKWRKQGYQAQVVSQVYTGRVYNSEGHSVYVKLRVPMTVQAFNDYKARLQARFVCSNMNTEWFQKQIDQLEIAVHTNNEYIVNSMLRSFSKSLEVHPVLVGLRKSKLVPKNIQPTCIVCGERHQAGECKGVAKMAL